MERTRWYKDGVFYQIWPRSFKDGNGDGMGDLYGVYEKLDHIKSLGVDGIWFSPLYPSPGADCGYDISDYMDIAPEFGGMEAFRKVLDGARIPPDWHEVKSRCDRDCAACGLCRRVLANALLECEELS